MADQTLLEARLEVLQQAYHTGATQVEYEGRTVKYRTLDEMRRVMNAIAAEIAGLDPAQTPVVKTRRVHIAVQKGV